MSKCANCDESAEFRVSDPGAVPVEFCLGHVPAHLSDRLSKGEFTIKVVEPKRPVKADKDPAVEPVEVSEPSTSKK